MRTTRSGTAGEASDGRCVSLPLPVRICLVYDCLFPYTVGGAERWYRNLAERLAAEGHEVTFLTRRQWDRGTKVDVPGVRVVALEPRISLYTDDGRRRIDQALRLRRRLPGPLRPARRRLRRGAHGVVPVLLAAGRRGGAPAAPLRPRGRLARGVDARLLARVPGPGRRRGLAVQRLCARARQRAFCFSRLHAGRLRAEGLRGERHRARGRVRRAARARPGPEPRVPWPCSPGATSPRSACPRSCPRWPGRASGCPACAPRSSATAPSARRCRARSPRAGLGDAVDVPGFVAAERVDSALAGAR